MASRASRPELDFADVKICIVGVPIIQASVTGFEEVRVRLKGCTINLRALIDVKERAVRCYLALFADPFLAEKARIKLQPKLKLPEISLSFSDTEHCYIPLYSRS